MSIDAVRSAARACVHVDGQDADGVGPSGELEQRLEVEAVGAE